MTKQTQPKNKEINVSQQEQSKGLYRPIIKEGTHLASSQDTPGTYRGTLYDDNTNKLVAHAEWERVDEDESEDEYDYWDDDEEEEEEEESSSEISDLLAEIVVAGVIIVGTVVVTEYVAPRVKIWWQNKAEPTLKKKWQILTAKIKDKQKSNLHTNEIVPNKPSYELEEAYQKYVNDITSEEAKRKLLDIFILSALLIAKITKLSNSRIIENGDAPTEYLAGQKVLEWLNTPEYISCINQILQNNPQLLEEKAVDFYEILGRNLVLNGYYIPIEIGSFKEEMPQTAGDLVNDEGVG